MLYYSTNHNSDRVDFKTALLRGLAPDGGLYMPESFPELRKTKGASQNFSETLAPFLDIPKTEIARIVDESFVFPVPSKKLFGEISILELFHGPTLSFKDFGARFMARAMNYYLQRKNEQLTIIVATSGDTGSAVASGFYGLSNIRVVVLYPSKRISELQEKQISTFGGNIAAVEVAGDFDDCQRLAKQALSDENLREEINLSSANSINIGRLLPQMFYYFKGFQSGASFVVPSGNFGNLTAGLFAKKIGLPVKKFIAAINENSVIPEFLATGKLIERKTRMTISNAMDVGKPSNWARITDLYQGDRLAMKKDLEAIAISEAETKKTISEVYKNYGYVVDPHTAVGVAAAFRQPPGEPKIVLATAHPAKFPKIVESAIGEKVNIPNALNEVLNKEKRSVLIKPDYPALKELLA
ncbi:MAG: threonine synthase [Candidatus Harrisonbacteria bacterium]|nr:threonine synthase [Candidatus Harrisonbacteria bacterium]